MVSNNDPNIDSLVDQLEPAELGALLGVAGVLPCPFCGMPPLIESDEHPIDPGWNVSCANKRCLTVVAVSYGGRAVAINAWNTRSTISPTLDALTNAATNPSSVPEVR